MAAPDPRVRILRFSVFELDLERRELRRRGTLVPLPAQPFVVLEHLLASGGQVVTREELRLALWPQGVHVDYERGLNYCMNRVRRALGDDAQTPRFIETLPRRGYRFLAEVHAVRTAEAVRPAPRDPARVLRPFLVGATALVLALHGAAPARHSEAGRPGLPSPDPAAQAAFERGRLLLAQGPGGWRQSIAWFEEAVRRDQGFALARYGLADAYMRMGEQGVLSPDVAFPPARRAALAALEIEERAEPLVILAALKLNYEWDWAGAERLILRALALDPELTQARLSYARLLSAAGRHEEALRAIGVEEARRPGCPEVVRDAAFVYYRAHRFDEAARRFRDWSRLEPKLQDPHHWLALLFQLTGRPLEARQEARLVLSLADVAPTFVQRFDALEAVPALQFYIRGSIHYLERLSASQWVTADDFARLRAHLGEREDALRDLRRAADERSPRLLPYLTDPAFDSLREDPRFQALVLRVRVPVRSGESAS